MDYFKHYADASKSKTINLLMDDFGLNGYAWWFLLMELCSENWDGKSSPEFRFHTRIVRQKLRISLAKLELFLSKCSTYSKVLHTFYEKEVEISVPNLFKIKTSRNVIKSNKKTLPVYKNRIEENRVKGKVPLNNALHEKVFNAYSEILSGVCSIPDDFTSHLKKTNKWKMFTQAIADYPEIESWEKIFSNFKNDFNKSDFWAQQGKKSFSFFFQISRNVGRPQYEIFYGKEVAEKIDDHETAKKKLFETMFVPDEGGGV